MFQFDQIFALESLSYSGHLRLFKAIEELILIESVDRLCWKFRYNVGQSSYDGFLMNPLFQKYNFTMEKLWYSLINKADLVILVA